ncbi:ABC transporter permease [Xylanimonas ulmi]|uniref:Transport permease protein n=1 Tax=Xylanimonas ulmi TaxID=228973 RepID=A0A4Q7M0S7_9MICO|nr:ABC transporter permease [Xylanibacterium ulmi]RZS59948.1 ABC-2 type transport system permease protein [Xylanibacterium ulmi]
MTSDVSHRAALLAAEPLRPAGPRRGFATGTLDSLRDLAAHRELLGMLVRRELKARYKDSTLGFVWSLLRPLAMLGIYYIVLGQFMGAARGIPGFAIFIFAGLTAWGFYSETISAGTGSIVANSGLVKKVYLPREVFPLASVGSSLFNFAMQMIILLLGTVLVGQVPTGSRWLYAVLALAVLLVYSLALGLVLGAVNVYLRDVQYLVEIAIMIFMWVSPIVYSWHFVVDALGRTSMSASTQSALMEVYLANPATLAVLGFQKTFWVAGDTPDPSMGFVPHPISDLALRLGVALAVGVVLLWVAQRVFARLQANFAQEL